MITIRQFLSDQTVYALGWTLIHSLWQIMFIAFLLYGLLGLLRNKSANSRYTAVAVAFLFITVTSVATFFIEYNHFQPFEQPTVDTQHDIINNLFSEPAIAGSLGFFVWIRQAFIFFEDLKTLVEGNLSMIVLFWILGLTAFAIRLAGNLIFLRRLRQSAASSLSGEWQSVITSLSQKIGISKPIRAFESTMAKVPMVIGHLRPLILIPAGLVFSIPPDQIEAILAHELAHIRRKDFLINTLKSVIEAVFFYHPFVWWLSSVFDQERENCCDDITITASIRPLSLSKALVNAEEFRMASPGLVMAFYQKKYKLLKRIKRMNTKMNQAQRISARSIALLIILAVMVGFAAKSTITDHNERTHFLSVSLSPQTVSNNMEKATLATSESNPTTQNPQGDKAIMLVQEGKEYKAVFEGAPGNTTMTGFWIDGKEVPQGAWNEHAEIIKEMKQKYNQSRKQAQMQNAGLKSEYKSTSQEARMMKDELTMIKKTLSEKKGELNSEEMSRIKEIAKGLEETQKNLEMLKSNVLETSEKQALEQKELEFAKQSLLAENEKLKTLRVKMNEIYVMEKGLLDQERDEYKAMQEAKLKEKQLAMEEREQAVQLDKINKVFYKNLLEDGIIKEGDPLSLLLSTEKMLVNEKNQPENIHKKYLGLYEKLHGAPLPVKKSFVINYKI